METKGERYITKNGKSFKSHYVVWKLSSNHPYISFSAMFKSHYVVWKQDFPFFFDNKYARLNRTM